eukprot:403348333
MMDFSTQTKYFFDTAQQCFDHCVTDFQTKQLSAQEKECTKSCFVKQMSVFGSLVSTLSSQPPQ